MNCCLILGFCVLTLEICVWPRNVSKLWSLGNHIGTALDYYILLIGVNIFFIRFSAPNVLLNFWFSWCLSMSTNQKWPFLGLKTLPFSFIVVIYSRIVNLQIFLWLSLYIKEWSLLTTSLPPVSCWRCICSGIYDKLDFSIKKVLNHCVSQSCVVNSTCEFSQTFVKFCATLYCYHVFLC